LLSAFVSLLCCRLMPRRPLWPSLSPSTPLFRSFLAPGAHLNVWYPHTFLAPPERNEPWLSSALAAIDAVVRTAMEAGVPRERVRSEEHTSELQSREHLVCRLLLHKKTGNPGDVR